MLLGIIIGTFIGAFLGVSFMCLLFWSGFFVLKNNEGNL